MTKCTTAGRVQGVIQEVVTDKIHQIAAEKWSGGGEGGGLLLLPLRMLLKICIVVYKCRGGMGVEGFEGVPLVACEPGRITASRLLLTAAV